MNWDSLCPAYCPLLNSNRTGQQFIRNFVSRKTPAPRMNDRQDVLWGKRQRPFWRRKNTMIQILEYQTTIDTDIEPLYENRKEPNRKNLNTVTDISIFETTVQDRTRIRNIRISIILQRWTRTRTRTWNRTRISRRSVIPSRTRTEYRNRTNYGTTDRNHDDNGCQSWRKELS